MNWCPDSWHWNCLGSKATCYLPPFFLRHQARVDLIVGSASSEIVSSLIIVPPVCWPTITCIDTGYLVLIFYAKLIISEFRNICSFLDPQVKLKLITAYQAEIQAARALFTKIMASGWKGLNPHCLFNQLIFFLLSKMELSVLFWCQWTKY